MLIGSSIQLCTGTYLSTLYVLPLLRHAMHQLLERAWWRYPRATSCSAYTNTGYLLEFLTSTTVSFAGYGRPPPGHWQVDLEVKARIGVTKVDLIK